MSNYRCRTCYRPVPAPKPGKGVLCPCRRKPILAKDFSLLDTP